MNRRTFLAGSASIFSAVSGGCIALNGGDGREGVILTHVELGNTTNEPQTFDILVIHDEKIIHWTQRELDAGGEEVIEIDSHDEGGRVEVLVRVDGEWKSTDFASDKYDGERVIAVVTYRTVGNEALRISRVVSDRSTSSAEYTVGRKP